MLLACCKCIVLQTVRVQYFAGIPAYPNTRRTLLGSSLRHITRFAKLILEGMLLFLLTLPVGLDVCMQ